MKYDDVTGEIMRLGADGHMSFVEKGEVLASALDACTTDDILDHLDHAGIIPECVGHDSTEEKLFAKYCDALVCAAFNALDLKAQVIQERADAADVTVAADGYSIVADAKAFRLSRTAKNQKDFKVEALNQWKKDADFACLVCPFYQYPTRTSQIYAQASRYNVTLLSYTHLAFLIRSGEASAESLREVWEAPGKITATKDAKSYWRAVNKAVVAASKSDKAAWEAEMADLHARLPRQATEQVKHWETEKARIRKLPHDTAVKELIKALKIDAKVRVIRNAVGEIPEEKAD